MKKLILIATAILIAGITYGQNLQKGNLVGTHVITITLKPGVTMEQFTNYFINTYIPAFEKVRPGWKGYLTKGVRGENANSLGIIIVIKSEKDRDKYFNADGTINELGTKVNNDMKQYDDAVAKLGTWTSKYTDWILQ